MAHYPPHPFPFNQRGLKGYNIQLWYLYRLMLKYDGRVTKVVKGYNPDTYKVWVEYPTTRKVAYKEETFVILKPEKE